MDHILPQGYFFLTWPSKMNQKPLRILLLKKRPLLVFTIIIHSKSAQINILDSVDLLASDFANSQNQPSSPSYLFTPTPVSPPHNQWEKC